MFNRASRAIRSRLLQAHQIASWCRLKLSEEEVYCCIAIRCTGSSLFTSTETAIRDLPPKETGVLFSVLHKCTILFAIFVVGNPMNHEVDAFIEELKYYVKSRCLNTDICTTALTELMMFTLSVMQTECIAVPGYAAALANLGSPDCTSKQLCEAIKRIRTIATRIMLAVFHESLPKLREEYSLKDMMAFTREFRREKKADDIDTTPSLGYQPIEYSVDDTEVEYNVVGDRVELSAFCKPFDVVSSSVKCSVCMTKTDATNQDIHSQAVVTKCGHVFHELCLDQWVNDSAMKASNTCPSCRTVLCKPRERHHASVGVSSIAGPNEDDDS
ncbi:hypothetical protein SVAN01_03614 [Stagonosporopsis vannaccii]|nr:hypothetical protein SVAN01_03614 [Stagonosporopsis vannaccii]